MVKRVKRLKTIVGALGGGKRARKASAKGVRAVRRAQKGDVKGAAKAGAGAIRQASKTTGGRQLRKKYFG